MYFLFKMGIFHCYVCLLEGKKIVMGCLILNGFVSRWSSEPSTRIAWKNVLHCTWKPVGVLGTPNWYICKYMRIIYGCFRKRWYPQIIHFHRAFHYKPSILGLPYFWKHPYDFHVCIIWVDSFLQPRSFSLAPKKPSITKRKIVFQTPFFSEASC